MGNKGLIKIINEEISEFDFLGSDERQEDENVFQILSNEDLQKQFICDVLLHKEKIKQIEVSDAWLGGNWEDNYDEANTLKIEYDINLAYTYDQTKNPIEFNLFFKSDNMPIHMGGWYDPGRFGGTTDTDIESSGEKWFDSIDYDYVEVKLFTLKGDDIEFTAFEKAPPKIQELFIKEYIESYIIDYTSLEIRDLSKDKPQDIPYC